MRSPGPLVTLILLIPAAFLRAGDDGQVTIHNRTGVSLTVRRPSGGPACAVLVRAVGDGPETPAHRLFSAFPLRSPEAAGALEYPFREGDTATFLFEDTSRDIATELVFWHEDEARGVVFKGTVLYTVSHPAGPDGHGRVEGRLALPVGPTPRTRRLPQNRDIEVLSDAEFALR